MDRALTELAEATVGLNSELRWTLSEEITRRQMQPIFNRCASGELDADQALDVCMDCVLARWGRMAKVFDALYTRLADRLTERYGDTHFSVMLELQEYFMGLESTTTYWSNNVGIIRDELSGLFSRVSSGNLSSRQGLDVCVDNLTTKKEYTLSVIQGMVLRLAEEISDEMSRTRHNNGDQQVGMGDEAS